MWDGRERRHNEDRMCWAVSRWASFCSLQLLNKLQFQAPLLLKLVGTLLNALLSITEVSLQHLNLCPQSLVGFSLRAQPIDCI